MEAVTSGTVTSADGTRIAFDRHVGGDGGGPAVIVIGGAFSYRAFPKMVQLSELLASHGLTVVNYDRRGRGDSGDPKVYEVDREIDDLAALIEAVGGRASLFGWSSGGGLALRAAASGRLNLDRVVAYEPPFVVDHDRHVPPADLGETLRALVEADRRGEIVRTFMTQGMGIPSAFVRLMRVTPMWRGLKAAAPSTLYDWAVMGEYMRGEPPRPADWAGISAPTLVLAGARTELLLRRGAKAIAKVVPGAEHRELPKLSHNPSMKVLAPVVADFVTARSPAQDSR